MKILMIPMSSIVAAVAILVFPQLCRAVDEELVGSQFAEKKAFTPKECIAVVKKVQESGRYTEESIVPICNEEMRSERCDFFAEALSLATSHADFKNESFCQDMEHAQFCSEIMDKLLESTAVSDLAFGECERAKPQHDEAYCRKIQQMLGYSVKNEDMDTMRACYMMEAYANFTTAKEFEASQDSPKSRIITGSSKELDNAGKGKGVGHTTTTTTTTTPSNIGQPDIVLQPVPLENFGKGKGNMAKATAPAAAAPAPAPAATTIIVEPIPAGTAKVASPAPATILVAPVPQAELQKQSAKVSSSIQNLASTIAQHATAIAPSQMQTAALAQAKVAPAVAQPAVAHAVMQNGTLVMTGAVFGSVEVAKHGIEDALKKQPVIAAVPKQVVSMPAPVATISAQPSMQTIAALPQQIVTLVPVAAGQNMQIPSGRSTAQYIAVSNAQVATSKSIAQPQVIQAVLQAVSSNEAQQVVQLAQQQSGKVVAASLSTVKQSSSQPAQPVLQVVATQPPSLVQPLVSPVAVSVQPPAQVRLTQTQSQVVAQSPPAAQVAAAQVPVKAVAQVVSRAPPVAPPIQKSAAQAAPVQVVHPVAQPVTRPVVQQAPAQLAQPVVQPVVQAVPVVQPVVQPVVTRPPVQAVPAVPAAQAVVQSAPRPPAQAAPVQVVQPISQQVSKPVAPTAPVQVVQPVEQLVSKPMVQVAPAAEPNLKGPASASQHIVQAVIVSSLAPVPQTQATSKALPAEAPVQKNVVTKPPTKVALAVPTSKDKKVLNALARPSATAPVQRHPALRTVSQHPVAGLTQKHLQRPAKVIVKKEKSDYSGFLSKFVA
jgi:hypothetical protein